MLAILMLGLASAAGAPLKLSWQHEGGAVYELFRGAEKVLVTPQLEITVMAFAGDVFHVVAVAPDGLRSGPSNLLEILPSDIPAGRWKITLYSAPDFSRLHRRKEAEFYQPEDGPARFWWAEIEKEQP